ncbi:related to ERG27 - 3-keto sterol reductase [Melanopsichium pennsylvanicum]|uniref:Related to ERG27 - 3-keto sterol reductase n=2 Tax=Melanopsichium pennsylvanicum TaxID=63383 RepID=A0AAJ5C4L3_9BASI|nr:related to ERG27-3-keto sterol reductase [Melanopsichium pennsylvanicum 4]SNX83806.1 related to ERG27 - 3-keto sterol reductase [Melanopsichium pennsylvanicum]
MSVPDSSSSRARDLRPVILVTGANAGVGFGICQRLIVQLSSPTPSDTLPFHPNRNIDPSLQPSPTPFAAPDGCTIVLACRNPIKAHKARQQLKQLLKWIENLPEHEDTPKGTPESWAYAFDATTKDDKLTDPETEQDIRDTPHEDADPALVAHAQENNVRRRRKLRKALANDDDASTYSDSEDEKEDSDLLGSPDLNASEEQRNKRANARFRRRFCQGTRIEFVPLDLGSMGSALECARMVRERYSHVTHVVLNAGSSAWTGMNWFHAVWMIMTQFRYAVTWPAYKMQRAGDKSDDDFGWVWQCNVGAHWILVRALLPSLRATPYSTPSRIVWTSSVEAFSKYYDVTDYECVNVNKSPLPYESVKYQCELAAFGLDDALQTRRMRTQPGTPMEERPSLLGMSCVDGSHNDASMCRSASSASGTAPHGFLGLPPASRALHGRPEPRSFLAHPGVCASTMMSQFVASWVTVFVVASFYIARWVGSPHHPIDPFKGAVSVSHACLAPQPDPKKRYGSRADFWGREYVGIESIEYYRSQLGGAGPGVGARLALAKIDPNTVRGDPADSGRVLSMAREYVGLCERMSREVWRSARKGDLPPWSSLAGDEFVVQEHSMHSSTEQDDVQQILDIEDARPPANSKNDNATITQKTTTVPSSGSSSEDVEWEKVQ